MLPHKNRFTRSSFPKSKPARRIQFAWGSVSLYEALTFKASVVVSKKTLPRAVDRNRATRRAYAALKAANPRAIGAVVFPRREALTAPFASIVKDLRGALDPVR
jgi:ribonuclease P protein component